MWSKFWKSIENLMAKIYPAPMETTPPQKPVVNTPPAVAPVSPPTVVSKLTVFCEAIRDNEGKPGDLNYQLNNPGDCRPSPVGYLPEYEPVVIIDTNTNPEYPFHKGKFAKFPTYALGWQYLINMVHFMAVNHPQWTILDFFDNFAPMSDGNPTEDYAEFVATRCGVAITCTLEQLFALP